MGLQEELAAGLQQSYAIERELGGGGMSRVFLARDRALDRLIVIKILPPEMTADLSAERFRREIEIHARLTHPHIVPTLSCGDAGGHPFYTMPYVDGETLRDRLSRVGELSIADSVHLLRDVMTALEFAHSHGVVHRDIKPENILLTKRNAVVTDFGIAKAIGASRTNESASSFTASGVALGTPQYMAPEQAAADPGTDHRADYYSLGAVAYEMLSGSPPFTGRSNQALVAAHATQEPEDLARRRPSVPPALAALVHKLMAKRPADRPAHADEVLSALDAVTTSDPGRAASPISAARRLPVAVVIGGLALIVAGAGGFRWWRARMLGSATSQSVAVLPFENLSRDSNEVYFAEGMAEELIGALGHVGLTVSGRTSAFRLAQQGASSRDIGNALHVATMVRGTIQRATGELRVTATLVRASDDAVLWSQHYVRPVGDVFQIQDEVSRAIAGELRVRLASEAAGSVAPARTNNLAAYDRFLKARGLFVKRGASNLRRAVALYSEAIGLDSAFLGAYAGRALCWAILTDYDVAADPDSTEAWAIRDADYVLKRSPHDPDARLALAHTSALQFRYREAEDGYRDVIAWDPSNVPAHIWYGMMLRGQGRFTESVEQERQASLLDPQYQVAGWQLGLSLIGEKRYAEALEVNRRNLAVDTTSVQATANVGAALIYSGEPDSARVYYERVVRMSPAATVGHNGLAESAALAGRIADARREIAVLRTLVSPSLAARSDQYSEVYATLNEPDSAFASLFRGAAHHSHTFLGQGQPCLPLFEKLRADPRWPKLMNELAISGCRELVRR